MVNHWTSTKGAKGRTVVVLVDQASERPSNELTLQTLKVHSEFLSYNRLTVLYGSLRCSQGLVDGRVGTCFDGVRGQVGRSKGET